jgi:hypothetical protein
MAKELKLPLPSADKVFADVISSQEERDDAKRETEVSHDKVLLHNISAVSL